MKIPSVHWPKRDGEYDDDLLLDIEAGVVALLVRGRNAWNSRWIRNWFRNSHLFSDVLSAKRGAEPLRQRGNVFYVREVPALLLRGMHESIILCEINTSAPFTGFDGLGASIIDTIEGRRVEGIYPGVSLRDATETFDPAAGKWSGPQKNEHNLLTGMVAPDYSFTAREGAFRSFTSSPRGSDHSLGWTKDRVERPSDASGVERAIAAWQQLAEPALAPGAETPRHSAFVAYRNATFDGLPRSQWIEDTSAKQMAASAAQSQLDAALSATMLRRIQLTSEIRTADTELRAAFDAQFPASDTSAGVRAQRLRVETARSAIAELHAELALVKAREVEQQNERKEARSRVFSLRFAVEAATGMG